MSSEGGGWLAIELKKAIDAELAADIEKQGAYVSPDILRVSVQGSNVRCQLKPGASLDETKSKLARYVDLMVSRYRKLPRKVLHTRKRDADRPLYRGVYQKLCEQGW